MRSERFSYASGYKLVEETELCDGLVPLWSFSEVACLRPTMIYFLFADMSG